MSVRVEVVLSDVHGKFRDKRAVDAAFRVIEALEPDRVFLNGDTVDFATLSKYDVDASRLSDDGVEREARDLAPFIARVDELSPEPVVWLDGNHEARYYKYFRHNAPRASAFCLKPLRQVLSLPERWQMHGYGNVVRTGRVGIVHGDVVRTDAGATALAMRRRYGGSIVVGHSHRLAYASFSDDQGEFFAVENGHLSQPPHYHQGPSNWRQGFTVLTHEGGQSYAELVEIRRGKAFLRGEVV